MRKIKEGFTLIEILFVIIIIGIIAAVVIVNLAQSSKDKARIAKGKAYSDSIRAKGQIEEATVSYWNFDNNTNDSWGMYNAQWNGTPSYTAGVNGAGSALNLNGSNSVYVAVPSGTALDITSEIVTIEAWIKPNDITTLDQGIVDRGSLGSNGYGMSLNGAIVRIGRHGCGAPGSSTSLNIGKWYHLVGVLNGANSAIYINGNLDNTGNISSGCMTSNSNNLTIGGQSGFNYFNGLIDDVRIYKDKVLTAQQIQQRYAEFAPSHQIAVK